MTPLRGLRAPERGRPIIKDLTCVGTQRKKWLNCAEMRFNRASRVSSGHCITRSRKKILNTSQGKYVIGR